MAGKVYYSGSTIWQSTPAGGTQQLRGLLVGRCLRAIAARSAFRSIPPVYGKSFDTGPLQVGAGSLGRYRFSMFLAVFLWLLADFPTFPALFQGLCSCGSVSVDRNLLMPGSRVRALIATGEWARAVRKTPSIFGRCWSFPNGLGSFRPLASPPPTQPASGWAGRG